MSDLKKFNKWFMQSDLPGSQMDVAHEAWEASREACQAEIDALHERLNNKIEAAAENHAA